ncbi:MAG: DUF1464 family protein, partial [Gemmatimonadales bacterium]|nr:DUF1464 family protein [Gemmatimonadales bacterium]
MPRVIGIDPGTVSIDVCGIDDGHTYLDRSWPSAEALADLDSFTAYLRSGGEPDLVAGPSGYGLPVRRAAEATDLELRLAFLAGPGEAGGIGGLRGLARRLAAAGLPLIFTPGVIHLDSVPRHRKLNRVDLGTADKLCAAVLGVFEQSRRRGHGPDGASFVLVELGGAFTAGIAVSNGRVVDGVGGSSGPIGWRAAGALDAEVAFLAGEVTKATLFGGGVLSIRADATVAGADRMAMDAYLEGAIKMVHQLLVSAPAANEVLLSGRLAAHPEVRGRIGDALARVAAVRPLSGFATIAKQGAQ